MRVFSFGCLLFVLVVLNVMLVRVHGQAAAVVVGKVGSCAGPCNDDNGFCDDRDECSVDEDCDDPQEDCAGVCPRTCLARKSRD